MKPQPKKETPTHGNRTDRKRHEQAEAENHYGGRTQKPDADVNEAADIHVEQGEHASKAPHSKAVPKGGTGGEPPAK